MKRAYIGIGSNLGQKEKNITLSLSSLKRLPGTEVLSVSSVYETEPWGYKDQDNFYNACALLKTSLSPNALLGALLGIEAALGRERPFKNSPRVIDLDLLIYEGEKISTPELSVPHPRIKERAFVLEPLSDIILEQDKVFISFDQIYKNRDASGIIRKFNLNSLF